MYSHLCKNNKCQIHPESLKYSENEIIKYSLFSVNNLKNFILNNDEYNVTKTPNEFIEELKDIYKKSRKNCIHCNKIFENYNDTLNHLFECININSNKINNINIINITNNTNIINNNNITNNININLTLPNQTNSNESINILSFDQDWNTDHIDNYTKIILFLSDFAVQYKNTLETILENDINKNVYIDNNTNTGLVYRNKNFEIMKIKDIVSESISKINKNLNNFSKDILNIESLNKEIIKDIAKDTRFKFINYKNNNNNNEIDLDKTITSVFNKYKDDTKENYIKYKDIEIEQNKDNNLIET
jgi:hypothetical protein